MNIRTEPPRPAEASRFDGRTQIAWPAAGQPGVLRLPGGRGMQEFPLELTERGVTFGLPASAGLATFRAAVEALTTTDRNTPLLHLACDEPELAAELRQHGYIDPTGRIDPGQVWQHPGSWLTEPARWLYPFRPVMTRGRVHPERRPKPSGTVYARHIPWLGDTLGFRVADPVRDLADFSRWMNDPAVAAVWEDDGPIEKHRAILEARRDDPHVLPLIGCFEGRAFGWFEVYWARENRLGPHYDCHDYDRGWHVAIGEPEYRGRDWITAWLPSLMHFIFLDDPRTQRIVGEPRRDHAQQIRNLDRAGFAKLKEFDFPHKRALLVMLLRERFFCDRLWAPERSA
jgi:acetyl CoA:N6-hydroxylysine acetyl transferase